MANNNVPFNLEGHMLHSTDVPLGDDTTDQGVIWKPIVNFEATMYVSEIERGKSSAKVKLTDENDRLHWMSIKEFLILVQNAEMNKGRVKGQWTFRSWGKYYSLVWLR